MTVQVIYVCTANNGRSPAAETTATFHASTEYPSLMVPTDPQIKISSAGSRAKELMQYPPLRGNAFFILKKLHTYHREGGEQFVTDQLAKFATWDGYLELY